jgi:cell division protein FtsL
MKASKLLVTSSILGAIMLSLVQIVFSSAFATDGIELTKLQSTQTTLEKENSLLKEKVYETASLTVIADEAKKMGYTEATKSRMVLSDPLPIALNQ